MYLVLLFLSQYIHCGYSLEPPKRGGSKVYPQCMFRAKIVKLSIFTAEKKICILHGKVFIMFAAVLLNDFILSPLYTECNVSKAEPTDEKKKKKKKKKKKHLAHKQAELGLSRNMCPVWGSNSNQTQLLESS